MAQRRSRGRMPHWEQAGATYFVTIRLADSIPSEVRNSIREAWRNDRTGISKLKYSKRISKLLDAGAGSCCLADPRIAQAVSEALRHFDRARYDLIAWCIMPNHVHIVFRPLGSNTLTEIMHSWKSFTAHAAQRILGASGKFWQREYYDHVVRSEEQLCRIVDYVINNPAKVGMKCWRWMGVCDSLRELVADRLPIGSDDLS